MTKNCFIWSRVSTKHQEENGGSLDDQKCRCERYARENGYTIKGYFGGKHESAKTPGKLIKEMITAVKKDKSVKYIIVNQADRFSRNAGQAINIINDLKAQDTIIVEALTGVDTSTPEGVMLMQIKLSLAQWDNTNRTNKFVSGRKHCMESGVWIGKRPLGYDKEGKSLNSQYTINETGKLIRRAFQWKLQGMSNYRIIEKLAAYGLSISKQKLHKILTNPFYAGKIKHKFTNGEIIDGKHPALISWGDFLRVQDILSDRTGIYKHQKETPRFPLKRHIRCAHDGTPMTAYTVKKKNIDYYKCNHRGCKNNIAAKRLHTLYVALLNTYNLSYELQEVFKQVVNEIIIQEDKTHAEALAVLKKQKTECEKRISTCKVRYGSGDIDEEIFTITMEALQQKSAEIEMEMAKVKRNLSNLSSRIDTIVATCSMLGSLWRNGELEMCEKIQNLLFPNGILWDKEKGDYRTIEENAALSLIKRISTDYKNKKEENSSENSSSVTLCG